MLPIKTIKSRKTKKPSFWCFFFPIFSACYVFFILCFRLFAALFSAKLCEFYFRMLCASFSSYGYLQFVFEFILPVLGASFSISFVLRFRVHSSRFLCFVFNFFCALFSSLFFPFLGSCFRLLEPEFCFRVLDASF